jgi:hypothetical protein
LNKLTLRDFKPVPVCVEKLGPNGHRRMKCSECGLEEDRGAIAAPQVPDGRRSFRSPRRPSYGKRGEGMKVNARPERDDRKAYTNRKSE